VTPAGFKAPFGASDADAQAVADYLTSKGFSNVAVAPNNLFVTANGTAASAARAFNTQLVQYDVNGETLYANATDAQVPAALSARVLSVLGLNDAPMHPFLDVPPNYLVDYTPKQFQAAYDVGATKTGASTPTAIFAQGDVSGVVKNLRTEETADGLHHVPVTVVRVGPGSPTRRRRSSGTWTRSSRPGWPETSTASTCTTRRRSPTPT
jgi:subtilase family serine protease